MIAGEIVHRHYVILRCSRASTFSVVDNALLAIPQVAISPVSPVLAFRNNRSDWPSPVKSPMPELCQSGEVPPNTCTGCGVNPFIGQTATDVGLRSRMSSPAVLLKFPVP